MTAKRKMTLDDVMDLLEKYKHVLNVPFESFAAELEKSNTDFSKALEDIEKETCLDFEKLIADASGATAKPAPGHVCGTQSITIRVPRRILRIFKKKAEITGVPYQSLMIRALNTASRKLIKN